MQPIKYFTSEWYEKRLYNLISSINENINLDYNCEEDKYNSIKDDLYKTVSLIDQAIDNNKLNPFLSSTLYSCNRANISHYIELIAYSIPNSEKRNNLLSYLVKEKYLKQVSNSFGKSYFR